MLLWQPTTYNEWAGLVPAHSLSSGRLRMHRRVLLSLALTGLVSACSPQPTVAPASGVPTLASTIAAPPTTAPEAPAAEGYPVFDPVAGSDSYPGGDPAAVLTVVGPVDPPADAPETAPATASISGLMITREGDVPIIDNAFYLMLGQGEDQTFPPDYISDPDPSRGDITGKTDSQGRFAVANIPPGKYFLFVWGPYGWREGEAGATDQSPLLLDLTADSRTPLGLVHISWP